MATWPTMTQSGGTSLYNIGGRNITNHEVFAFTLKSAPANVGALISNVTVFLSTNLLPSRTSYGIILAVVDTSTNPTNGIITGNFESNGV